VRFSPPVQTGPGGHPASCTIGTESFQGVKSGRGVTLTLHPFLVPWSRKSTAIPLLPLWAVRPVLSHSACKRVHTTTMKCYITMVRACARHVNCGHNTNKLRGCVLLSSAPLCIDGYGLPINSNFAHISLVTYTAL